MQTQATPRTPQQLMEHVLDGCTRAKVAVIALRRLGCLISQVSVGGRSPTILIAPPRKVPKELEGETLRKWTANGGTEMTTYQALFMNCRVEWTTGAL